MKYNKIKGIKSNKALDRLTPENDFLDLKNKSEQVTSFIISYYSQFKYDSKENYKKGIPDSNPIIENPMLVLYGNWGSGKTSVMKDIEYNLKENAYNTLFFNAWEYEKDGNLPLSLFDSILLKLNDKKSIDERLIARGKKFLKRIKLKSLGFGYGGGSIGFELTNNSFYSELKSFKEDFQKIESEVLKDSTGNEVPADKLIIFIDDLDRCEPENVLSLLSAIKLFFTYTKRTFYFCGIDKKAVEQAVKIKYNDVVKSEEYLEKIFDISFNMPREINIEKMIKYYLQEDNGIKTKEEISLIINFFKAIDFTTARHLKKLLNKYRIIKYTKDEKLFGHKLIPDLDNVINVIFVLYFMILYDFFPKEFDELENYDGRMEIICNYYFKNEKGESVPFELDKSRIKKISICNKDNNDQTLISFFFLRKKKGNMIFKRGSDLIPQYIRGDNDILSKFILFIENKNLESYFIETDYKFLTLVDMAKTIL